jgi:hypothetical protein
MFWIVAASFVCLAFGFFLGVQGSIAHFKRLDPSEQRKLLGFVDTSRLPGGLLPPGWKMPEPAHPVDGPSIAQLFEQLNKAIRDRDNARHELLECWCIAEEKSPDDEADPPFLPAGAVLPPYDAETRTEKTNGN